MTTQLIPVMLVLLGWAAVVAGIWLLAGLPWALISAGGLSIAAAIVLYDPAHGKKPRA